MDKLKKVSTTVFAIVFSVTCFLNTTPYVFAQSIVNDAVDYIDANGEKQIAYNVNVLTTGESRTLTSGWYMLRGTHCFEGSLTIIGDVHLILEDRCNWTIQNGGICVSDGQSLTFYDQSTDTYRGKLTTNGSYLCAGIGGNGQKGYRHIIDGGNITINGGVITAEGGYGGAGIGGGGSDIIDSTGGKGGNITINGGVVTATGGGGAGIGGGFGTLEGGDGGNITINGGVITAVGGGGGAGIGGGRTNNASPGYGGNGGVININGGRITANGGEQLYIHGGGAGIGGGAGGQRGSATHTGGNGAAITINGGTISANGASNAAGIGGATGGSGGEVIINGGSINANGKGGAAQRIGKGDGDASILIPKNSEGFDVYLNSLVAEGQVNSNVSSILYGDNSYGTKDVYTDESGMLYLYLPESIQDESIRVMIENVLYSASYTRNGSTIGRALTNIYYNITATADIDCGTVSGDGIYFDNEKVILTAVPKEGYTFNGWYENGEIVYAEPIYTFAANSDRVLQAKFDVKQYSLKVGLYNSGGTVSGTGTYSHNEYVTITATPDDGYVFDSWYNTQNGGFRLSEWHSTYSFYITSDIELQAIFAKLISITAVSGNGGTVSGGGTYKMGSYATLTANPNSGYIFEGWYENNESLKISSKTINIQATSDRVIEARFIKIVNAAKPNITKQPISSYTTKIGDDLSLSVIATSSDSGTLTYQWYSNTTNLNYGGTIIAGATNYNYSVPTTTIGTKYYYCTITNTNNAVTGAKVTTVSSNVATVIINKPQDVEERNPELIVESKKVLAGKEFTVCVKIKNNPGFTDLVLTPVYSSDLTLVSVKNGELFRDMTQDELPSLDELYIWWSDNDISGDGILMTFTFSTAASIEPGSYEVGFIVYGCINNEKQDIGISVVNGVIEVGIADFILGDVNGDGKINGIDLNYLKRAMSGSYNINAAMDINGDGKVNGTDVNLFKRFLAGSYIIE